MPCSLLAEAICETSRGAEGPGTDLGAGVGPGMMLGGDLTARFPPPETLLVLVAATLWGSAGLFVRELVDLGLSPLQVVYYANGLGFLALLGGLACLAPRYL